MADLNITVNPSSPVFSIEIGPPQSTLVTVSDGIPPHNSSHAPGGCDSLESWYATTGNLAYVSGLTSPPSGIVYTTGNQDVSGVKNFFSRPTVNGSGVMLSGEIAGTGYLTGYIRVSQTGDFVDKGSTQTISGQKTFTKIITAPTGLFGANSSIGEFEGQTIAGGKNNFVSGDFSSILGGNNNYANGEGLTVGGGGFNYIDGADSSYSVIAGGRENVLSSSDNSVIAGGSTNSLLGNNSSIGGGASNTITGNFNSIVGGFSNSCSGEENSIIGNYCFIEDSTGSFAIGRNAQITHNNASIITTHSGTVSSSGENTLVVRYDSGIYLNGPTYFNNRPTLNNTGFLLSGEVVIPPTGQLTGAFYPYSANPAAYVQGAVVRPSNTGNFVDANSTQTISGRKTFTKTITAPTGLFGTNNVVADFNSQTLAGGEFNTVSGNHCSILGGGHNTVTGSYSSSIGGSDNNIGGLFSASVGGYNNNIIDSDYSSAVGGGNNLLSQSNYSFVGGGVNNNVVLSSTSSVLGGLSNTISGGFTNTVVGESNTISESEKCFALGYGHTIVGSTGCFAIGSFNSIIDANNAIVFSSVALGSSGNNTAVIAYDSGIYLNGPTFFDSRPTYNGTGFLLSGEVTTPSTGYLTGYVNKTETGNFYPRSNPSGYITGVDLSSYATATFVTGISGYQSGLISNLQSATGILNARVTSIEGITGTFALSTNTGSFLTTGVADSRYISLTGDQNVSGVKNFISRPTVAGTGVLLSGESITTQPNDANLIIGLSIFL